MNPETVIRVIEQTFKALSTNILDINEAAPDYLLYPLRFVNRQFRERWSRNSLKWTVFQAVQNGYSYREIYRKWGIPTSKAHRFYRGVLERQTPVNQRLLALHARRNKRRRRVRTRYSWTGGPVRVLYIAPNDPEPFPQGVVIDGAIGNAGNQGQDDDDNGDVLHAIMMQIDQNQQEED